MENPQIGDVVILNSTSNYKKPLMTVVWVDGYSVICTWYSTNDEDFKERKFHKDSLTIITKRI